MNGQITGLGGGNNPEKKQHYQLEQYLIFQMTL